MLLDYLNSLLSEKKGTWYENGKIWDSLKILTTTSKLAQVPASIGIFFEARMIHPEQALGVTFYLFSEPLQGNHVHRSASFDRDQQTLEFG